MKWAQLDSNQRPSSYEPPALTTELWALAEGIVAYCLSGGKREIEPFVTIGRKHLQDEASSVPAHARISRFAVLNEKIPVSSCTPRLQSVL